MAVLKSLDSHPRHPWVREGCPGSAGRPVLAHLGALGARWHRAAVGQDAGHHRPALLPSSGLLTDSQHRVPPHKAAPRLAFSSSCFLLVDLHFRKSIY